jgi:hypothetical protein
LADEKIKYTEGKILELLHKKYLKLAKFKVSNVFLFRDNWESDFFFVRRDNNYSTEIEIKCSRSDFFNDIKKTEKHSILQFGKYNLNFRRYDRSSKLYENISEERKWDYRPNKFFYCVPENLIKVEEIPNYAGLMYVNELGVYTIKEAKFLHKEKLNFEKKLCIKFYYYWLNALNSIYHLNKRIEKLEKENNKLKNK